MSGSPEGAVACAGIRAIEAIVDAVPGFLAQYPSTLIMDRFSDHLSGMLDAGASESDLRPYFEWIEELASQQDPALDNLLTVSFIEAGSWGKLGAAQLMGPHTKRLARHADPRLIDLSMLE